MLSSSSSSSSSTLSSSSSSLSSPLLSLLNNYPYAEMGCIIQEILNITQSAIIVSLIGALHIIIRYGGIHACLMAKTNPHSWIIDRPFMQGVLWLQYELYEYISFKCSELWWRMINLFMLSALHILFRRQIRLCHASFHLNSTWTLGCHWWQRSQKKLPFVSWQCPMR